MTLLAPLGTALSCLGVGLAAGLAYFSLTRRTAALIVDGQGVLLPVSLTLARLLGIALVLTLVAQAGALALISAFIGVLAARTLTLRRRGRAA